tara:strand:+ start:4250 stop:6079 length:1830 start_codon:yes stop_codon:yes gene_type:complete
MNKIFIVFVLTFLLGCNNSIKNLSLKNSEDTIVKSNPKKIISSLNNYTAENESLVFAEKGVDLLNKGKYYEASDNFNLALKLDITNSYLQFFNAHTYHLIAKNHDTSKFDLAEEGYKLAIQFDKDNSQAYFYLGQLYLDQKKYSNAKNIFLEASYIDNSDSDLFYSLSFASYYALDPELALSTLKQACAISPIIDKCSKDMTIIKASLGEVNNLSNDQQEPLINQRVVDWNNFYENHLQYASFHSDDEEDYSDDEDYSEDEDYSDEKNSKNTKAKKVSQSSFQSDKQVITDVVIIQSREELTTSKGVNLLSGLQLQFGDTTNDLAAYNYTNTYDTSDSNNSDTSIIRALNIPAITYSLNIANINSTQNEILARPSLISYEGEESTFFVGKNLKAAVTSSVADGDGIEIDDDIGISLSVTPKSIDGDNVKLNIKIDRTFISAADANVNYTYQVIKNKTFVDANFEFQMGDTLIISGLSEKEVEEVRDGVPLLQDIPLVQYFFSKETTMDFNRSVLILVTPRKPEFTSRSKKTIKNMARELSVSEAEIINMYKSKYKEWFRPYPNWASVFNHLNDNQLYREFRTGDVTLEKWPSMSSYKNRLNKVQDFLFF